MDLRVEAFKFLFLSGEMKNTVDAIIDWGQQILIGQEDCPDITNSLFSHVLPVDLVSLHEFSKELFRIFMEDQDYYKRMHILIFYRILKKILAQMHSRSTIRIDQKQIRLVISPTNFSAFISANKLDFGDFVCIKGIVSHVEKRLDVIIRQMYRCSNSDCLTIVYRRLHESDSTIGCPRCSNEAARVDSGAIHIPQVIFKLIPEGTFSSYPLTMRLRGSLVDYVPKVRSAVEVIGKYRFSSGASGHINVVSIKYPPKKKIDNEIKQFYTFGDWLRIRERFKLPVCQFRAFLAILASSTCNLTTLLVTTCSATHNSLLNNVEKMYPLSKTRIYYPRFLVSSKAFNLSQSDGSLLVIPHFELIQGTKLDMINRKLQQRTLSDSPAVFLYLKSSSDASNAQKLEYFDLIVRVKGEGCVLGDTKALDRLSSDARKTFNRVSFSKEAVDVLSTYTERQQTASQDVIIVLSKALCSLRRSSEVSRDDVIMSIYYIEEKEAFLSGYDTQVPSDTSFFIPDETTSEESLLFQKYKSLYQ